MAEQTTLFENPRWTILLEREEADTFEETDFKVQHHFDFCGKWNCQS